MICDDFLSEIFHDVYGYFIDITASQKLMIASQQKLTIE